MTDRKTDIPIAYDPPITDSSQLQIEQQEMPDKPDLVRCRQQMAPVHSLAYLRSIPVMRPNVGSVVPHGIRPLYCPLSHTGGREHRLRPTRGAAHRQKTLRDKQFRTYLTEADQVLLQISP